MDGKDDWGFGTISRGSFKKGDDEIAFGFLDGDAVTSRDGDELPLGEECECHVGELAVGGFTSHTFAGFWLE